MIDGTVDGGGHAAAIIRKVMPGGRFLGVEWDPALLARCCTRFADEPNASFVHGNYADLPKTIREKGLPRADGLLIDLGFSSEQLEGSGRGFSFSEGHGDEPLLMTYDDSREPVGVLLRTLDEAALADIIFELGGERRSRRIANAIKLLGKKKPIMTSGELAQAVRDALPGNYERGRIDPATRTFQALRIYANDELGNLRRILEALPLILAPGGRVAIISFHSLEDRIVKRSFQNLSTQSTLQIITKKPITASRAEITQNPRSRSAKLRAAIIQ